MIAIPQQRSVPGVEGLLVVDKPTGLTSHDVVARVRRATGVRKVGHAGTLDPLATGVLLLGLGRATRLLGHLARHAKEYVAGIRIGVSTDTYDADGQIVATCDRPWDAAAVAAAVATLTGPLEQRPPAHSALKVDGKRAYARARAGEEVALAPRPVMIYSFDVEAIEGDVVTARIVCSAGTYVRSLARDLGEILGTGAHLASLRRTWVGPYGLESAVTLDDVGPEAAGILPLADAVRAAFPVREVDETSARELTFGRMITANGSPGVHGAFGPDGVLYALVEDAGSTARPVLVFEAR